MRFDTSFFRLTQPPISRVFINRASFCLLTFLLAVPSAFAAVNGGAGTMGTTSCIRTDMVSEFPMHRTAKAATASTSATAQPILHSISVDDTDLVAKIEAEDGFSGSALWIDESGIALEEPLFIDPADTIVEVRWSGAVQIEAVPGFQHRLQIKELGNRQALVDVPVRLQPICPSGEPCRFEALIGVDADVPLIGSQLAGALKKARSAGAKDVIGYVQSHFPELAQEAVVYGWQLGATETGGQKSTTDCRCSWVGETEFSESAVWGQRAQPGPTHSHGAWTRGIHGNVAGQTVDGTVEHDRVSFVQATLGLECRRQTGVVQEVVNTGARPVVVTVPVYEPCTKSCDAEVTHIASSSLCVDGKVFGGNGKRATAELNVTLDYEIDEEPIYSHSGLVELGTTDPAGEAMTESNGRQSARVKSNTYSSSKMELSASMLLTASEGPWGGPGSYAFGALSTMFNLALTSEAFCEGDDNPTGRVTIGTDGDHGGGVMMVRWGDPPS